VTSNSGARGAGRGATTALGLAELFGAAQGFLLFVRVEVAAFFQFREARGDFGLLTALGGA
jgi:hypothetical protein